MSARPGLASIVAALYGAAQAITTEMQAVLDKHNVYRCMHGVPLLTWNDTIAKNAQTWADKKVYAHSSSSFRVVNKVQLGENIAWGYPTYSGTDSTIAWYSEIQFTDPWGTAKSSVSPINPQETLGHYTQVVWKTTTSLGCGKGKATIEKTTGDFWVCQYGPAGNYVGQYKKNVLAPTKNAADCKGLASDSPSRPTTGGGKSGAVSSGVPAELPSQCIPSPLLPVGGLCVYGYQCASSFCCPMYKVCMESSSGGFSFDQIKVSQDKKTEVLNIIQAPTCSSPWSNSRSCMNTASGKPLPSWNQSNCGCNSKYMSMYSSCDWVKLNQGVTCKCGGTKATLRLFEKEEGAIVQQMEHQHEPRWPADFQTAAAAVAGVAVMAATISAAIFARRRLSRPCEGDETLLTLE